MKICLLNSFYHPDQRGGAEQQVQLIAEHLSKKHDVYVICSNVREKNGNIGYIKEKIGQITVYRLFSHNISNFSDLSLHGPFFRLIWHIIDIFNIIQARQIRVLLNEINPDLVWSHNLKGLGLISTKYLARYHFWQTIHDVQLYDPSGTIYFPDKKNLYYIIRWFYSCCVKIVMYKPSLVISPTNWLYNFYFQKGYFTNCAQLVIANPINLNFGNVNAIDKSNNIYRLLYLGQIEEHKGIFFLISALQKVKNKINFHLTIVGNGQKQDQLKKLILNDEYFSYFTWPENNQQLAQYFSQTDLLIFPSLCLENCPVIVQMALQLQIPLLASNSGGIKELVNNQDCLFNPGDQQDFIAKILQTDISKKCSYNFLTVDQYCQLLFTGKS